MARKQTKRLVAASALVVLLPVVYFYATQPRAGDELELAILKIGFSPLHPPVDDQMTGSIYYTNIDGTTLTALCPANKSIVNAGLQKVGVQQSSETTLRKAKLNLEGRLLEAINLHLGADTVQSVNVSFSDVYMYQLDGITLGKIEDDLLVDEKKSCGNTIDKWFDNKGLICQVQSTLFATVDFSATTRDGTKLRGADKTELRKAISASSGVEETAAGKIDLSGKALLYGVRFKPKCMVKSNEADELLFPVDDIDKMMLRIRFWFRRNLNL